ncbi:MAG: SDR family oxidoreductase [Opitutales bacterium]|jgi:NAD(P)-dependent dehydrogenase (short-subunit alcohol dehydrogenase family)
MSKVWFITGAGSGIGTGIGKAALRAGDRVVATGRNLEKVRRVFPDVAQESIAFVQLDVVNEAQAKTAINEATRRFGRIDVLVNNAGYSLLGNFEQMTTAEIQQQFAPNFYGVVHVMQAALPVMRRQRSGHIINLSSVAGVVGLKHCAAYAATKFAVEGLSLSVATEVEQFGIKVTVVEPGFFRTDLLDAHNVRWVSKVIEDYAPEGTAEDMWSKYSGTQPNDPAKLGDALVKIAAMQNPPKVFAAGSDALGTITPAIEERLRDMRVHETLSKGMEGSF